MDILDELTDAIQDFSRSHGYEPEKIELSSKKWKTFTNEVCGIVAESSHFAINTFRGIPIEEVKGRGEANSIVLVPPARYRYFFSEASRKSNICATEIVERHRELYGVPFWMDKGAILTDNEVENKRTIQAYERGWCL